MLYMNIVNSNHFVESFVEVIFDINQYLLYVHDFVEDAYIDE